jgi:peptidoglycan/LPS O-acetylase OafA/YrhL
MTAPSLTRSAYRVPELDGLRGFAIALVIVCHYVGNAGHAPLGFWTDRVLSALSVGWSGVDLFFVLSGFLIGGILIEVRGSPHYFRAFYMRRVFRILPIYYLWILLYAAVVLAMLAFFPGRSIVSASDLLRVPYQLLFLQNIFIGMASFPWTWFVVTWSLAVEEQFYLVAPVLIRFASRRVLVRILIAVICLAPVIRFLIYRSTGNPFSASMPMPCRADALSWGILLAVAWRSDAFRAFLQANEDLLRRSFTVLLLGFAALLWWLAHPAGMVTLTIGLSWVAAFYACLLLLVVSQTDTSIASFFRWSKLQSLGTISYCVYILHDTVNLFSHRLLLQASPQIYNWEGIAVTMLALCLTLSASCLSWRFFEKPLLRRGHAYSYDEPALIPARTVVTDTAPAQP